MSNNRFSILYTHQKTKKRKVWQDGFLVKKEDSNTVVMYDDNNYPITSFMRNKKQVIATGEEFECSKYLIQVEDLAPLVEKGKEGCAGNDKENMIEAEQNFHHEKTTTDRTVPVFKPQKRKFVVPGVNGKSGREIRKFKKPFCAPKKLDQGSSNTNNENNFEPIINPETSKSMENKTLVHRSSAKSIFTIVDDLDISMPSMDDIDLPTFTNENDNKSVNNDATFSRQRTMEVLKLLDNSISSLSKTTNSSSTIPEAPQTLNLSNPQLLDAQQISFNPSSNISNLTKTAPACSWKAPQQNNSLQNRFLKDLFFPSKADVNNGEKVGREATIPTSFTNVKSYCYSLIKVTQEYLNLLLYNLSKTYHDALEKVDIESYMSTRNQTYKTSGNPKGSYCTRMCNVRQIQSYLKRNKISMYCECTLVRRADVYRTDPKLTAWLKRSQKFNQFSDVKKKTYIQLPFKEKSSVYNKNDIWVVSDSLNFDSNATFIAKSTWYGPSSENLVEIDCMSNYVSSKWANGATIYAIHAGNASTELSSIKNIEKNVNEKQFPLLPHLLSNFESDNTGNGNTNMSNDRYQNTILARDLLRKKSAPLLNLNTTEVENLLDQFVEKYQLNSGQRDALSSTADMLCSKSKNKSPIVLVHGVFGSGKSFLLSVIILFLSEVAKLQPDFDWKILLSSTTNVAVDRVLNCLLDAGFTDICRIGSFKKISHAILPYSVHTKDKNEQIKELQSMLADKENSQQQRALIKKSLDQVRRGITEQLLSKAIVVGATCAATTFPYLQSYKFPIVIVDECTQSTEPHILLPLAPFSCQYALLVGDPNQLPPTIEGAPAKHSNGLEQTMFNRLQLLKYEPVKLQTQYRCHPDISKLANELFYDKCLIDGVDVSKRVKILSKLNHLTLFDTSDGIERRDDFSGSFYNERESTFISEIIKTLIENGVPGFKIGVIALYRAQVLKIKECLENLSLEDKSDLSCIQVSTVDAFQGAEKEIIILSCVRSTTNNFINVKERMCVALTRAKVHLLIVGHLKNLKKCENWDKVVQLCENNIQTPFQFRKIWKKK